MSKPTKTQKNICDEIIRIIRGWKNTNDIDSPTHSTDMYHEIHDFGEQCDIKIEHLHYVMQCLFKEIKRHNNYLKK